MQRLMFFLAALALPVVAQEESKKPGGPELIAAVKAAKPKGDIQIRATVDQKGQPKLQIQIRHHRAANGDKLSLYQVLFPRERKGEGLALRDTGSGFTGWSFKPGETPKALKPSDREMPLFGTDLLVEDLLADFLDWTNHKITGTERLGAVPCSIVESNAPASATGRVKKVRSWIDDKRLVPQKIELLDASGKTLRTIMTERVHRSSTGYFVPTEFTVTNSSGSETKVTGAGVRDDLTFTDDDFSDAALAKGLSRPE